MGIPNQPIRGFVGQGMDGKRATMIPYAVRFYQGTYSFSAPYAGRYKFVAWGPGGDGQNIGSPGSSGAYGEISAWLGYGETVAIVVGARNSVQSTTITFRNGKTASAGWGAANGGAPGVATGFDVSLDGSANGANGLGSGGGAGLGTSLQTGAPGILPFRGGTAIGGFAVGPGVGGAPNSQGYGSDGEVIVLRIA